MYSVIMGRLGEDLVAANSIMASLRSVATVLGFGVANGTAILLGKAIGAAGRRGLFPRGDKNVTNGTSHNHLYILHLLGGSTMKVTFIYHSSYFVELDHCCLLFDYYQGDIPQVGKPLYVFASHSHPVATVFLVTAQHVDWISHGVSHTFLSQC